MVKRFLLSIIKRLHTRYFGEPISFRVDYSSTADTHTETVYFSAPRTYSVEEVISWRIKHGLSYRELSKRSGLPMSTLRMLEVDWKKVPLDFVIGLCKAWPDKLDYATAPSFELVNKANA